jgi:hypothetical protein
VILAAAWANAGERQIVLRDYIKQRWTNELLTYPFEAPAGECHPQSLTLKGPRGQPVPVQLSEIKLWPGNESVRSARLSFITSLAPLAKDTYTVHFGPAPATSSAATTDLKVKVAPAKNRVEITTSRFGVRVLLGGEAYPWPVATEKVPGPILQMRLGDGTWFGASQMYGPGKISAFKARLVDAGPVSARTVTRYVYANGNTLDLSVQVAAGDNTMRLEACVQEDQPSDGFRLVLSAGLPPFIFRVQHEGILRREEGRIDQDKNLVKMLREGGTIPKDGWVEVPLADYVAPQGKPVGLVTALAPWKINRTFALTMIRLRLEGTPRELQLRTVDPGAWVEPRADRVFGPDAAPNPPQRKWLGLGAKAMPLMRGGSGEIFLQVNAARGARKWTLSDCLSLPEVGNHLTDWNTREYKPESAFPPETGPLMGRRLDEVKDYLLHWPGDEGKHPRLFMSRSELKSRWKRLKADPALIAALVRQADRPVGYTVTSDDVAALRAYLLSGGDIKVATKTHLLARLHQLLTYDLSSAQFSNGGMPATVYYDTLIDSPVVPEAERSLLRARMAYFGYRLTDPGLWSAERGFVGTLNMTVVWELSRGLMACAIPEHPMARTWYRHAERIMEHLLAQVGPGGEWIESLGSHGNPRQLLAFALGRPVPLDLGVVPVGVCEAF